MGIYLPFHEGENIAFAHGTLDVSNNGAVGIVEKLDTNLSHVTRVARAAEHLVHLGELDWLILFGELESERVGMIGGFSVCVLSRRVIEPAQ